MKKNIVALNFIFFLFLCGIFYLIAAQLSNYKAKDLENLTIEKARASVNALVPAVNRAIENSDDISLLSSIEFLAKQENVTSSFILDTDNTVIIHNNTGEWNSKRANAKYNDAINYDGALLQMSFDKDHILYSVRLAKHYTLCCIFSVEKSAENARLWKIKYFTIASVTVLVILAVLYFLSKLLIALPFNRTKKRIENASSENIKNEKYDEIADIFATEGDKYLQKIKVLEEDKKSLSGIIEYYAGNSAEEYKLFIILNSVNNIVSAYDKTEKFLKKEFAPNANILEASLTPELLKTVSQANDNPGKELTSAIGGFTLSVLSISDGEKKTAGTIITAQ